MWTTISITLSTLILAFGINIAITTYSENKTQQAKVMSGLEECPNPQTKGDEYRFMETIWVKNCSETTTGYSNAYNHKERAQ